MNLPTITLHQPWASLVICGAKRTETRSWAPPPGLAGQRIGIHAAKRPMPGVVPGCELPLPLLELCERELDGNWDDEIPLGCLLGTVLLDFAKQMPDIQPFDNADVVAGDWRAGRWGWRLAKPERFPEPIPMRGYQKIWTANL